jgi:amylosucrase
MDTLLLKKEWIVKCENCGRDSHCDEKLIQESIDLILLLHSMIMAFGGIPLIYYGDEIGTLNDYSYLDDDNKTHDSRWMHRPRIDWEKAERRHEQGSVEQKIFDGLKKMIAVRKTIGAFADFNNRELIELKNPHLFAFWRTDPFGAGSPVLVVANFDDAPQYFDLSSLGNRGMFQFHRLMDLYSGESPALFKDQLVIPPFHFYWLTDERPDRVM